MTWEELKRSCKACTQCTLCETRTQVVFGSGNPESKLLMIGEAPGREEDEQGMPFVGRSGKLLEQLFAAIDLDREQDMFLTNLLKCHPPQNRDPSTTEQKTCMEWLKAQVALMKPKLIVCVGRIAAQRLMDQKFQVMKQHGQFYEHNGIWRMGTFHPAVLLRNPHLKPAALQDFLDLQAKISELLG